MPQSVIVSATRSITWRSDHSRSVGAEGAAEVLLGDDVRGVLRPRDRELDVGLEEGVGAVLVVLDAGVAPLPLHGVVRVGRPAP